jgi:hypothetical protein
MIAWQHDFLDFAFFNHFGDALAYDGNVEQHKTLKQCLSIATRECPSANAVMRRELSMPPRRGEPQEFASRGTKARYDILSWIKAVEMHALIHARNRLHQDYPPSQTRETNINEKSIAWCDMRRLGIGCSEEDFVETSLMPIMCEEAYMELRAFMTRHRRAHPNELWTIAREIMSDPNAQSASTTRIHLSY